MDGIENKWAGTEGGGGGVKLTEDGMYKRGMPISQCVALTKASSLVHPVSISFTQEGICQ